MSEPTEKQIARATARAILTDMKGVPERAHVPSSLIRRWAKRLAKAIEQLDQDEEKSS